MKNFYGFLYFLMSSFFPFSSNSTNKLLDSAIIIKPRPTFHQIVVEIELPSIENEESTEINLALCENHPWSLNQCQTQKLQGNKRTFAFKDLKMATSYQIGFMKDGKISSQIVAKTKSFKILAITCQTSRTQVLVETGSFFNGLISLEPLQNNERKKDEVKCDMKGDPNSSQSQYLFTIHHDTCHGVYSNKTSVQATLIVQENWPIMTSSTKRFRISCDYQQTNFTVSATGSGNPKSYPYPINVTNDETLMRSHRILQGGPRIAASFIQQKDTKQRDTKTDTLKVDIKASKLTLGTNDEESKSWFKIGQDEKYPASHIALMVICVVSATVGTIATSMWIKSVISSKISMAGLNTTNEKMSSTEDKLVSTSTSDIQPFPTPPYENITFSFDSTPKCLSVEANSSFV